MTEQRSMPYYHSKFKDHFRKIKRQDPCYEETHMFLKDRPLRNIDEPCIFKDVTEFPNEYLSIVPLDWERLTQEPEEETTAIPCTTTKTATTTTTTTTTTGTTTPEPTTSAIKILTTLKTCFFCNRNDEENVEEILDADYKNELTTTHDYEVYDEYNEGGGDVETQPGVQEILKHHPNKPINSERYAETPDYYETESAENDCETTSPTREERSIRKFKRSRVVNGYRIIKRWIEKGLLKGEIKFTHKRKERGFKESFFDFIGLNYNATTPSAKEIQLNIFKQPPGMSIIIHSPNHIKNGQQHFGQEQEEGHLSAEPPISDAEHTEEPIFVTLLPEDAAPLEELGLATVKKEHEDDSLSKDVNELEIIEEHMKNAHTQSNAATEAFFPLVEEKEADSVTEQPFRRNDIRSKQRRGHYAWKKPSREYRSIWNWFRTKSNAEYREKGYLDDDVHGVVEDVYVLEVATTHPCLQLVTTTEACNSFCGCDCF